MRVYCSQDSTQESIVSQLNQTEKLMCRAGRKISGRMCDCEIVAMEDLGLSHNLIRMKGGFYTGMYVKWDCPIPFVPIDSTINSCGVSLYTFHHKIAFNDFIERMKKTEQVLLDLNIVSNFNVGNHFICCCHDIVDNNYYLLIHSSDNTHKFGKIGLYPHEKTWYMQYVKTISEENRFLRYITGDIAERFYEYYKESEICTPKIHDIVAEVILQGRDYKRFMYKSHYGMPDMATIAIGCQWEKDQFVLLTSEGKNIYIVKESDATGIEAFPHGFGVRLIDDCKNIEYLANKFCINGIDMEENFHRYWNQMTTTRFSEEIISIEFVMDFLRCRNIKVVKELKQLYSFSATGFNSFDNR